MSLASSMLNWHPHSSVWIVMGGVLTFFWWAITRLGPTLVEPGAEVISRRQQGWIVAGVAWTWIFADYPIHDISEKYLFLVHMVQHTVFTLVAPACFLLGAPIWLWKWALHPRVVRGLVRFLTKPLVALLVFNALVVITHLPQVVQASVTSEWFHFLAHLVLFSSATLMWVPVINRTDLLPRLKTPTKMVYLFAQSIVPTVPASFLTFAEKPMYQHYADAPRFIAGLSARADQQWAAVMMKLGAGTLLWSIVGYLFVQWWKDSQAGLADDNVRPIVTRDPGPLGDGVLTWDQVQAEFDRLDRAAPDPAPDSDGPHRGPGAHPSRPPGPPGA